MNANRLLLDLNELSVHPSKLPPENAVAWPFGHYIANYSTPIPLSTTTYNILSLNLPSSIYIAKEIHPPTCRKTVNSSNVTFLTISGSPSPPGGYNSISQFTREAKHASWANKGCAGFELANSFKCARLTEMVFILGCIS